MNILLCSNFYYRRGGDTTYLFALAGLLQRRGHPVSVFSMRHPRNEPCAQSGHFVEFIDYAELNRQRRTPGRLARVLSRSIYSRQARRRLRDLIAEVKPDLAHLQNIHAHLTPSILHEFRRAGIPVVWTLHDYKLLCPEDSFVSNGRVCEACKGGRFYQCALRRCKKGRRGPSAVVALEAYVHRLLHIPDLVRTFISPSRFLRDKFIEFGWRPEKIRFVRNFLERFPPDTASTGGYGIYVGSLRSTKGVWTLLRALLDAPDVPVRILGDGPERPALEAFAREHGLARVTFRGQLGGQELEREVAGAGFGVAPSEWYENCPYAVMELMAAGKPVIASRLGGLPEMVEHERTGLLVAPGRAEELAEAIRRLAARPDIQAAWGRAARARAEQEFSPDRHYEQVREIYTAAARG